MPDEVTTLQYAEPAVANADAGIRSETLVSSVSLGCSVVSRLGCRDIPAQGLTPPLHPRKGFRPLTRFRWRDPLQLL